VFHTGICVGFEFVFRPNYQHSPGDAALRRTGWIAANSQELLFGIKVFGVLKHFYYKTPAVSNIGFAWVSCLTGIDSPFGFVSDPSRQGGPAHARFQVPAQRVCQVAAKRARGISRNRLAPSGSVRQLEDGGCADAQRPAFPAQTSRGHFCPAIPARAKGQVVLAIIAEQTNAFALQDAQKCLCSGGNLVDFAPSEKDPFGVPRLVRQGA
jgi:hypothetical protein